MLNAQTGWIVRRRPDGAGRPAGSRGRYRRGRDRRMALPRRAGMACGWL